MFKCERKVYTEDQHCDKSHKAVVDGNFVPVPHALS